MTDRRSDAEDGRPPREDRDLAALVEELSATLDALRSTVGESPERRAFDRRTGGLPPGPTPPSPRELLRFTEQYTIPTLIALLESGVRSLELLRATLRLLDGRGMESASPATRERVEAVGRTTLDRVDGVLSDLSSAVEGGEPSDPEARELLEDARALREEIDDRLRGAERGDGERDRDRSTRRTASRGIPVRSAGESAGESEEDGDSEAREGDDGTEVPVDVDAELESIREDVAREGGDTTADHEANGETGDGDESGEGDGHEG